MVSFLPKVPLLLALKSRPIQVKITNRTEENPQDKFIMPVLFHGTERWEVIIACLDIDQEQKLIGWRIFNKELWDKNFAVGLPSLEKLAYPGNLCENVKPIDELSQLSQLIFEGGRPFAIIERIKAKVLPQEQRK